MKLGALQPGYLPWLGFFEQMHRVDKFLIHDELQYTRRTWRNRNYIRAGHERQLLTVPVRVAGRLGQKISEVRIDNRNSWWRQHWKSIEQQYGKAPHFHRYADFFEGLYRTRWDRLADLDVEIIRYCAAQLGIRTEILVASNLDLEQKYLKSCKGKPHPTGRIVFLCREFGADEFFEGAMGRRFTDVSLLKENNIGIVFQKYRHPVYEQFGGGKFIPFLSAIDLMFCHGPDSLDILPGKTSQTCRLNADLEE